MPGRVDRQSCVSYSEPSAGPALWAASHPGCGEENQSPVNLHTVDVALREHKKAISFSSYDKVNMDMDFTGFTDFKGSSTWALNVFED